MNEMQNRIFALCFLVLIVAGCSSDDSQDTPGRGKDNSTQNSQPIKVPVFTKQKVPSSSHSRRAMAKVAPKLMVELKEKGLAYGSPIFIRIFKKEMQLELWLEANDKFELFCIYPIVACSGKLGPKLREGDHQAPEGFYYVPPSQMNPNSSYHLSFNLGYPNAYDKAHSRTGSALMVHGSNGSVGCFAMGDRNVEKIYALADAALRNGQPFFRVHCFPFRMTDQNMKKNRKSKWLPFWLNLKQGYDFFEAKAKPPNTVVRNKNYVFED